MFLQSFIHYCLADLIMLGLATHEPNFTIIREEFKMSKPKPCEICNQEGHSMNDCTGAVREKKGEVGTYVGGVDCEYSTKKLFYCIKYL